MARSCAQSSGFNVASAVAAWSHAAGGYPEVDVPIPTYSDRMRVLVEELERHQAVTDTGQLQTPAAYQPEPSSLGGALNDLLGTRPVWVATTPLPLSV